MVGSIPELGSWQSSEAAAMTETLTPHWETEACLCDSLALARSTSLHHVDLQYRASA